MKINRNTAFIGAVLLVCGSVLLLAAGCSSPMKYYARPDFDVARIKKIAVLPFENYTSDGFAGEKVRKAVITEMLTRGIEVIEPGEVTRVLMELKIRSLGAISVKDIKEIEKALGVEAVMTGSVESFGISTGIAASYPEVTIQLTLLEAPSGNILWSVWRTSGGAGFWTRHFGVEGLTLGEAAKKVIRESVNTMFR